MAFLIFQEISSIGKISSVNISSKKISFKPQHGRLAILVLLTIFLYSLLTLQLGFLINKFLIENVHFTLHDSSGCYKHLNQWKHDKK